MCLLGWPPPVTLLAISLSSKQLDILALVQYKGMLIYWEVWNEYYWLAAFKNSCHCLPTASYWIYPFCFGYLLLYCAIGTWRVISDCCVCEVESPIRYTRVWPRNVMKNHTMLLLQTLLVNDVMILIINIADECFFRTVVVYTRVIRQNYNIRSRLSY